MSRDGYDPLVPSRNGFLTAAVAIALIAAASAAPATAASATPRASSACKGVNLLSAPLLVEGIWTPLGNVVLEISGPLDDLVQCQLVDLRAPASRRRPCENADVPGPKLRRRVAAKAIDCLIDKERRARGLGALGADGQLRQAAKRHSRRMIEASCFSHQCSGEPDLVGRIISANYLPCTCVWTVGENIAWGARSRSSPAAIVQAWMNSPPHRALILSQAMEEVGIGVKAGRPGNSRAKAATYTADFGAKR